MTKNKWKIACVKQKSHYFFTGVYLYDFIDIYILSTFGINISIQTSVHISNSLKVVIKHKIILHEGLKVFSEYFYNIRKI